MITSLVVIGAGGFGREALDVVDAMNRTETGPVFIVRGVVDDSPSDLALNRLKARGVKWLGGIDLWLQTDVDSSYVIGVGSPTIRASIERRLSEARRNVAKLIHPSATIGSMTVIGEGSVICSGVEVSTNVSLGRHVHLNPNSTVGHDAVLDEFVSVNPGAIISGDVSVGHTTLVGAGAVILQGLSVGYGCVVGAASCVTRNITNDRIVKGVPAR